jgi:hypothetical protein
MPARALRREAAALVGYVCVALVFAWPLPLRLADAIIGLPNGDAGVYAWNLWVFRHEIVDNHRLPFLTSQILALSEPVPLALHNYTTFANILALPLISFVGVIASFNLLVIASGAMSGYAMYAYARMRTGDAAAAWVAGLMFGFSPFMSARAGEHFSLTLAAPLPLFGWVLYRVWERPSPKLGCAGGAVVAWAFLCDVYYAVYCLMIAGFTAVYSIFSVERQTSAVRRIWPRALIDFAILCVLGLIVGMLLHGGGRMDVLGMRVSFTRLYTPVLFLTLLIAVRIWMTIRPRLIAVVPISKYTPAAVMASIVCIAILTPVLTANGSPLGERPWMGPQVWWRNSAPGVDLLAYVAPNPMHPLFGGLTRDWIAGLPNGFNENVATIPFVALVVVAFALLRTQFRPPRGWVIFTGFFSLLALGPFITVASRLTYIPTPWALLRYAPIVGAARMPTRITVLVMMGASMLTAMALQHLRSRSKHPRLLIAIVGVVLAFELLPAPRVLTSAEVPSVYRIIAADPRPVRLLSLPFGLRDGLTTRGDFSSSTQFFQIVHGKRLVGGYVSRLPRLSVSRYRRHPLFGVLLTLSEGSDVDQSRLAAAFERAPRTLKNLNIGYVIIDTSRTSPQLIGFAKDALQMTFVARDGALDLYRTPQAPPIAE